MTTPDPERLREALLDLERSRLRERELRLSSEALLAGVHAVALARDEESALVDLLGVLREALSFADAFVLTGSDDAPLCCSLSTAPHLAGSTWARDPFLRRVLAGQPAAVFDVSQVPAWQAQPSAARAGIASALHVGLRLGTGAGVLVGTHPERGFFTAQHARLARQLAPLFAQALLQRDLRRASVERDRLFELSVDMICVLGCDGRVRQANPAWSRTFGLPPAELVGVAVESLVHPDDRPGFAAALERATTLSLATTCEVRLVDRWEREHWVQWSLTAFPAESLCYGVARDVTARKQAEEQARHLALHDPLTGLPNRVLLRDRARQAITLAERRCRRVGVLFVDLDGFKQVNDSLGHEAGDGVLRAVADRLRRCCVRASDTVSRVGGDEFILILQELGEPPEAAGVAARIVRALAAPVPVGQTSARLGASVGVAIWPENGANLDALVRAADGAMYRAKLAGGARFELAAASGPGAEAAGRHRSRTGAGLRATPGAARGPCDSA